jgi:glycerol-3-phosphate O-acyltransferase
MGWLLRRILTLWVRFTTLPGDAATRLLGRGKPVCYVMEHRSLTDFAVLNSACVKLKLPRPRKRLLAQSADLRSFFYLDRRGGLGAEPLDRRPPPILARLVDLLRVDPAVDVDLVPAAVFWGRAPQREASWFRLLLVDDWVITSRVRRFFQVIFNGRNTLLELDEPVSLRSLLGSDAPTVVQCRRVARALRVRYARQRAARIGPDLSHRRTIVGRILRTRAVRAAVAQEVREKKITRRQGLIRARKLAYEIAANYSPAFVRFLERVFSWLWTRIYDGVDFGNADTLAKVADGHEIIYVPCHRSHMDYLLLSYVIYRSGYAIPHIAAGLNLNMPVVGRYLRKGGAFFIRRSLRGNALYTIVFMSYMAAIMARGHSIEYFIEGGRSRTGRLMQPKTGMLTMTLRGFLRSPARPIVFLPVFFAYERVMEADTYIGELSGKVKEKESIFGLLRTLPRLKDKFGKVHVNIGEPIHLEALLERHDSQWRSRLTAEEGRQPWLNAAVDDLANQVMRNINAAAAVTPIGLLALALLASPRRTLVAADLLRQLTLLKALLADCPYSARVTVTDLTAAQIVAYGEEMKAITRRAHPLGDLVQMSDEAAVLAAYYRNNIVHLFALPSLIACAFAGNAAMSHADIVRLTGRIYPYIASELFLIWPEDQVGSALDAMLVTLEAQGLLERNATGEWCRSAPTSPQAMQLSLLQQSTIQTIERYYLAISLLLQAGSGQISQAQLEERCHLMAQRMSLLYGFNSPEFFDRALFENFIDLLRKRRVIRATGAGKLEFDEVLMHVAADAQVVLNEELRHSILQVTHS